MKKILSLGLILIFSSVFFAGCKKDKGDPPILPPQESMTIDFSNFDIQKKSDEAISLQKGTENSNWEFAAGVAGIWKLIINTTLIVPVTSFKLATDQVPVFLSKNNWQWSYSLTVATVTFKARLTGEIRTSDVAWKMYIAREGTGSYPEFVWFEGTSKIDGTGGQWILNQSSLSPTPVLQIDWTQTGSSVGSIKYTYVKTGDAFKTSYIEYGLTTSSLNAYYTIHYYNSSTLKFSEVNVEWNTTTHNGRVKCLDYLGDTNWHCWDANKINVTCL
jgi:hypothetical protein